MSVEGRLRAAFTIVAVFLLIVGGLAILLVGRLNSILHEINTYEFRLQLVADAQCAFHRREARLADHVARVRDLEAWASSDAERRLIQEAVRALAQDKDLLRAPQLLDELAGYYRNMTRTARAKLNSIHKRAVIAVIIVISEAVALLIVILFLIRSWVLQPAMQFHSTVTRILRDGPVPKINGLTGEFEQAALAINTLAANCRTQQERLERAERLAHMGEAVTFIVHNLTHSLNAIRALAQYERNAPSTSADSRAAFDYIDTIASRLEHWVRDAINSTRAIEPSLGSYALESIVRDALALVQPLLEDKAIQPTVQLPDDLPPGRVDRALFQQALVAVITNAIEASPDGGQITLTAQHQNGTITLSIADHGPGMSADQCQRARHPFFTTKPGAVGLGLTIADKIIRQHQGKLEIDSGPRKGTTVKIVIPAAASNNQ